MGIVCVLYRVAAAVEAYCGQRAEIMLPFLPSVKSVPSPPNSEASVVLECHQMSAHWQVTDDLPQRQMSGI